MNTRMSLLVNDILIFFTKNILLLFTGIFIVRLILSFLPPFEVDMNAWLAWANRLTYFGPGGFYSDEVWTQYTPGFLYWLFIIGKLGWVNDLAIKIPVIFADIMTAFLIYNIVKKHSKNLKVSTASFFLYVFNPVVIFTGSIWGQIDGILTLFLVLSAYLIVEKENYVYSGISWALAFLIKPQAIVFLPVVYFVFLLKKSGIKKIFMFTFFALITTILLSIPFYPEDPVFGIFKMFNMMAGYYDFTSVFAFNFWAIVGMWKKDSLGFLNISYYIWGIILYILSLLGIIYAFFKKSAKKEDYYLLFSLGFLSAFLFPTRVHERYLFPAFAFLLISALLSRKKILMYSYLALSGLNFLNLYHPYAYYSKNFIRSEILLNLTGNLSKVIAVLKIAVYAVILKYQLSSRDVFGTFWRNSVKNKKTALMPKVQSKGVKYILIGILAFAFLSRVLFINNPEKEYFDEVYHAFTARRMLVGDPKAWEWWNTPPEGYAYEWSHPPLAKLGMVLGMIIFGENPFGWRIPGVILGVISIYLLYLITRKIFKDEVLALLAAFLFSLDGLFLVISRIGMNDVYFLTFALASFYFFLPARNASHSDAGGKDRPILSSIMWGLSLSSKWSALWLVPVLFIAHIVFKKKINWSYLFFVILPPLIYIGSYLPFFTSGHSFSQFFNINVLTNCFEKLPCDKTYGVTEQMWYYHTNLKATHPYTSPWWSWPLSVRPIYLYTADQGSGLVSKIYLIDNPLIGWAGFLAVLWGFWYSFKNNLKTLAFVVLSYMLFFVPWALSPRIMFLYHYLPSIPFMCIVLGYFLRINLKLIPVFLCVGVIMFLYFFPHWTGMKIPLFLDSSYYWFSSWR